MNIVFKYIRLKFQIGSLILLAWSIIVLGIFQYVNGGIYEKDIEKVNITSIDFNPSTQTYMDPFYRFSFSNGSYIDLESRGDYKVGDIYNYTLGYSIIGRKNIMKDRLAVVICFFLFYLFIKFSSSTIYSKTRNGKKYIIKFNYAEDRLIIYVKPKFFQKEYIDHFNYTYCGEKTYDAFKSAYCKCIDTINRAVDHEIL